MDAKPADTLSESLLAHAQGNANASDNSTAVDAAADTSGAVTVLDGFDEEALRREAERPRDSRNRRISYAQSLDDSSSGRFQSGVDRDSDVFGDFGPYASVTSSGGDNGFGRDIDASERDAWHEVRFASGTAIAKSSIANPSADPTKAGAAAGAGDKTVYPQWTRWVGFFVGCLVSLAAGTQYAVSVYADQMRETFGCTQGDVSIILAVGDMGLFAAFAIGRFFDRYGPRWTSTLSLVLLTGGYAVVWAQMAGHASRSLALLGVAMFCIGQGSNGLNTICLTVNMKNFPLSQRGVITGVTKAFFGLCAFVVTNLYQHACHSDAVVFLRLLTISTGLISALSIAFMFYTNNVPTLTPPSAAAAAAAKPAPTPTPAGASAAVVKTAPEMHSPVPMRATGKEVVPDSPAATRMAAGLAKKEPAVLDITGRELFRNTDFWVFWVVYMLGQGIGVFVINNVNHFMVNEAGGTPEQTNIAVMCLSVSNCAGRLSVGFIVDLILQRNKQKPIPTVWMFVAGSVGVLAGQLSFIAESPAAVIFSTSLSGYSFGVLNTTSSLLTAEFFGTKSFGYNYGFVMFAQGVGGIFTALTSSHLLSLYTPQGISDSVPFNVGLTLAGTVLALYLVKRRERHTQRQMAGRKSVVDRGDRR